MKRIKKGERLVLRIKRTVGAGGGNLWTLHESGGWIIDSRYVKSGLVESAAELLQALWELHEQPGQLVVCKADGSIQSERTYPDTTPEREG